MNRFFKKMPLVAVLRTDCGEAKRKQGDLVGHSSER